MPPAMTREEIIDYAAFLFGNSWQTPLAREISMDRTDLVRALASNRDLPNELLLRISHLKVRFGDRRPAITAEEVVDFAIRLYGPKWQEPLSAAINVDRASLVRLLAAGGRLPLHISNCVIELMTQWMDRQQDELDDLRKYLGGLKRAQRSESDTRKAMKKARHGTA